VIVSHNFSFLYKNQGLAGPSWQFHVFYPLATEGELQLQVQFVWWSLVCFLWCKFGCQKFTIVCCYVVWLGLVSGCVHVLYGFSVVIVQYPTSTLLRLLLIIYTIVSLKQHMMCWSAGTCGGCGCVKLQLKLSSCCLCLVADMWVHRPVSVPRSLVKTSREESCRSREQTIAKQLLM